jgi:LysM repeat protein
LVYVSLLLALAVPLGGCEIVIGAVATPTPGGPPSSTPQVRVELTPVPSPTAAPPTHTAGPAGEPTTYKVKAGDNLSSIALQFGVTVEDIVKANNIEDPNQIYEGQELIIPPRRDGGAAPAPGPNPSPTNVP